MFSPFGRSRKRTLEEWLSIPEIDMPLPSLEQAKKQRITHFGKLEHDYPIDDRQSISTPRGSYFDNLDGTVSHESGLTWIRAPWGMLYRERSFFGAPILMPWGTATYLFGKGTYAKGTGAVIIGEELEKSDFKNGYQKGRCRIYFAGQDDWRLPVAKELDLIDCYGCRYGEDHHGNRVDDEFNKLWSNFGGSKKIAVMERLFPEFMRAQKSEKNRNHLPLWSATEAPSACAWGYDGNMPLGDFKWSENGHRAVIFVRSEPTTRPYHSIKEISV